MTYPRTFSHIGISVTDLDQAVDFYTKTLGWYVIMPATEVVSDDSAIGVMCNDVFGEGWGRFRIAHMATGDRVGVEIFEFANAGGLEAIGGNLFVPTAASGDGHVLATSGGVIPGAIAQSNVNIAEQAVNTILDTNALRANINAFRAQDEMLGELLNIQS